MRQYDAYLFDLYGTLVDIHTDESKPALWRAAAEAYTRRGASYTGPALRWAYLACAAEEEKALMARLPEGTLPEIELRNVFSSLYRQKGVIPDPETVAETAVLFRSLSTTHLRAYAGARELLQALRARGSRVILLSNAQSCFTLPELRRLGLLELFDRIYISSDAGCKKPDFRFFSLPLRELEFCPDRCLMIGNDPDCDILGAARAGMDAFYLQSGLSPRGAPPPETLPAVGWLPRMDLRALQSILLNKGKQNG